MANEEFKKTVIANVKKQLKAITQSNSYFINTDNYSFTICFKTNKYLLPIDKQYNRDYTILDSYKYYNSHEVNELLHALIICKQLKAVKESNMPLHIFINEVLKFVGMCTSMLAYYTDEKYFTNRELYNLPESTKKAIYNYMKSVKKQVNSCVGEDSEGNTYNSIVFENVIK